MSETSGVMNTQRISTKHWWKELVAGLDVILSAVVYLVGPYFILVMFSTLTPPHLSSEDENEPL